MKFLDLRIEFSSVEVGRWNACITGPSAIRLPRESKVDFTLPFSFDHLQNWLNRIRDNVMHSNGLNLQVYRAGKPPNLRYLSQQEFSQMPNTAQNQITGPLNLTEAMGTDMFRALFQGQGSNAYSIYSRSRRRASERGMGLCIRLVLPDDGKLGQVPFEYLYDPWVRNGGLTRESDVSIVRAVPVEKGEPKGSSWGLLRLWYVLASPESFSPINDFDIISDATMNTGLKVVPFPVLNASTETLTNRLRTYARCSPHVIHVAAHGDSGWIFFEQSGGHAHPVLAQDLAAELARAEELRLVVFTVCDFDDPVSYTLALCRQGVAAVTMQFPITAGAAKQFQAHFYKSYFADRELDSAVAEGRHQIAVNISNTMEWGTPVMVVPEFPGPPVVSDNSYEDQSNRLLKRVSTKIKQTLINTKNIIAYTFRRLRRWLWSLFAADLRIRLSMLITGGVGLFLIGFFCLSVLQELIPKPPISAIQQVVVYTGDKVFKAPDNGKRFEVTIRGEGGKIPIEVLTTPQNRSLDFAYKVWGPGTLKKESQRGHEVRFEYSPTSASIVDVLEFCIHEPGQGTKESCLAVILDIRR
jgi:hypothetical protein